MSQTFGKFTANTDGRTLEKNVADDVLRLINSSIRGGRWRDDQRSPSFSSVMNYGNSPLAVFDNGVVDLRALTHSIKNILIMFETRIEASSLNILATTEDRQFNSTKSNIQWPVFIIRGTLRETGGPFYLRMRIDITYGHASTDM
jgi:predicted component of type VI protein secretion system